LADHDLLGVFPVIPQIGVLGFFLQPVQLFFFISEVKDAPEGSAVFDRLH
jgi:hypothetical protein